LSGPAAFAVGPQTLADTVAALPPGSTALDVGCAGWMLPRLAAACGRGDLVHLGADLHLEPPGRPEGARFLPIPEDGARFAGPVADLVVASHCLEHSARPIPFFGALLEACRPGGLVYVESPSERSALAAAAEDPRDHAFLSFWDDPTHVRPWTPGALYRLALGHAALPLRCGRLDRDGIPCAALLCRRGERNGYRYVSLKDVPWGPEAALASVWSETHA
jgi:hypothetical protein